MSRPSASRRDRQKLAPGGSLELVGRTEAAEILGVMRTNLEIIRGLPAPVVDYLKAGKLYLRGDIEDLAERRSSRSSTKDREESANGR